MTDLSYRPVRIRVACLDCGKDLRFDYPAADLADMKQSPRCPVCARDVQLAEVRHVLRRLMGWLDPEREPQEPTPEERVMVLRLLHDWVVAEQAGRAAG